MVIFIVNNGGATEQGWFSVTKGEDRFIDTDFSLLKYDSYRNFGGLLFLKQKLYSKTITVSITMNYFEHDI